MKKIKTFTFSFIAVLLVIASVFGLITRKSYKRVSDIDSATYQIDDINYIDEEYERAINTKLFNRALVESENIFVVTVQKSDYLYHGSNTLVTVDMVIKGEKDVFGGNVIIHEPNSFYCADDGNDHYSNSNAINNLMQAGKSYLVFCNRIVYHPKFQARLDCAEFKPDDNLPLYSFPLEYEEKYIDINKAKTFKDIKQYDYICFNEEQCRKLSEVREEVLNEYLPKNTENIK